MPAHHLEAPMADQHTADARTDPPTASTTPHIAPTSAVRVARVGGTLAELAAAAISAHTLYHLGGQLELGHATAWLLPAALDTYAFTALAVGYNLPTDHPGQKSVLRNARLAFAMTLGANALDHFLQKAGRLVDPTVRDLLLVAVATLPPLVVERLLNLQSVLVGHRGQAVDQQNSRPAVTGVSCHTDVLSPNPSSVIPVPDGSDSASGRPDWFEVGREIYDDLGARLGRRPTGREFQSALAEHGRGMIDQGRLSADARPPSVTTAKRIRAALEATNAGGRTRTW
jgi:hypothetical protein